MITNRFNRHFLHLAFCLALFRPAGSASAFDQQPSCTSTKEFAATLRFLRSQKDFDLPEPEMRQIAKTVSEGCTGAALRFMRTVQVLGHSGVGSKNTVASAIELSRKTDRETETFIAVFKRAYLSENLDLDVRTSLKMARSLSIEFDGDVLAVRDDFEKILDFCVDGKNVEFSKNKCGSLAARLAQKGQNFSGGVAQSFIEVFEFLVKNSNGPKISVSSALQKAEELASAGPAYAENYIRGYLFATADDGLQLNDAQAMKFAQEMANKSSLKATSQANQMTAQNKAGRSPSRSPASSSPSAGKMRVTQP